MKQDIVRLKRSSSFDKSTFLGVGPMSINCVDAAIELANQYDVPIILIASRRQIDSHQFGGGYVNNWTTEQFCNYVNNKNTKNNVFLARDHGGPWQSEVEVKNQLNEHQAMSSAKESYSADISAGMDIIHIDPGRSLNEKGFVDINQFIERTKDLMMFCYQEAARLGKTISIEVGTDEGIVGFATPEETEDMLINIIDFCNQNNLKPPSFMVVQTGTKVMEMQNVGILDKAITTSSMTYTNNELVKLIELCKKNNVILKEHNADYLSSKALSWHTKIGIDSSNVAPEFGVIETRTFLNFLKDNHLHQLYDNTIELAFNSGKWKKWMLDSSTASDHDKAIIAGHYIFATDEFKEIKNKVQIKYSSKGIDINSILKDAVKIGIYRYLSNFGVIRVNKKNKETESVCV